MGGCSLLFLLVAVMMVFSVGGNEAQLQFNYYESTCPPLEAIVKKELLSFFLSDPTSPSAFLRLMFHDCQVQGCDGSILLDSGDSKVNPPEILSSKNFGIRKREAIEKIKSILEIVCPGQVSCADIISLAAKESVLYSGGPLIQIPLGRKDSKTSRSQQADARLPSPMINVDQFLHIFMSKGMNLEESVAILGAHTLGVGHCLNIVDRLYDPTPDDRIDLGFKVLLRTQCPTRIPITNLTFLPNDLTPMIFDNQYYRNVLRGKGLFGIDSSISRDSRTAPIVMRFAVDQNYFFQVFASAFIKLSSTNILTGRNGEIRRQCNRVNSDKY